MKICVLPRLVLIALLLAPNVFASSPEYIESDNVGEDADIHSPMDYSFEPLVVFTGHREMLDDEVSFRKDSSLNMNVRSYTLMRDNDNANNYKTSALGGELNYNSGWYDQWLQVEVGLYTSQKVYGPSEYDGSGLLQEGQEGYSALGKLNAKLRIADSTVRLYRSELNTPFANQKDIRMTPLLFENYSVLSQDIENVDILASVVTSYKDHTSQSFDPMLENIDSGNNNDLYILGSRYHYSENLTAGAIGYRVDDYINIAYAEYQWDAHLNGNDFSLGQQYIEQHSNGKEVGGEIDNHTWGLKAGYTINKWIWTGVWHQVSGDMVRTDWGSYPGYNSMIVRDFNRADEKSWRLGVEYDLSDVAKGLSVFGSYIDGDTPESGKNKSTDESEIDLTLQYAIDNRYLKGLDVRLRYAKVDQDYTEGNGDLEDFRLIINYQLPLF